MLRENTGTAQEFSKTDILRRHVSEAQGDNERLVALVALARHYADAADGVNGLTTSREARALALRLKDYPAAADALSSASISHYHRSDYVSAVATAMDAWDFAVRANAPTRIADSYFAIALSMMALGVLEAASQVIEKGLAMSAGAPELHDARIRLVGLKAMLRYQYDDIAGTETLCAEAVTMSVGASLAQRALSHGNWGIALLRSAEKQSATGIDVTQMLVRSRENLQIALELAEEESDDMRIADRMASLGMVAMLAGNTPDAEHLLEEALRRSVRLDYVRTAVSSALYLGRLNIQLGNGKRAVEILRQTVDQARRGVAADMLPAAQLLLADALDLRSDTNDDYEADLLRSTSAKLREDNAASRALAAEDARQLAARVLG